MKLVNMVKGVFTEIRTHWSKPAKGKCISYKEMMAYSVGGMGVNFIAPLVFYITLGAGSLLVGSTFGIKPMDLQIMNIIAMVIQGYIVTPIRGMLIDNTRSKYGKFRPYIFTMGIPTSLFCCALVFLPIDQMSYIQKAAAVFIAYNLIQITYNFFFGAYSNLVQVMSPNTEERATTMSVSSVIYSLAPTITGFLIPILADIYKDQGGMTYIGTYRIVMPIFSILGVALSMFAFFGTKERLVVSKKYVAKVGFAEGISKMAHNKYFWIITATGWFAILKAAAGTIMPWLFIYDVQNNVLFGVMTTVMGTSALFPMLLAPIFINLMGKRNLQILANLLSTVASLLLIPAIFIDGTAGVVLIFLLLYVFNFAAAFLIIVNPAMTADMRDYQQYRTGDRLEGIEGTLGGLVGTVVTAVLGLIIPAMQESFGLLDDYNVLFDETIRRNIFAGLAVISVIGSVCTGIPYLAYDLTEKKHQNIIKVLRVRALFADYRNGDLTDAELVETIDAIDDAIELSEMEKRAIDKSIIAEAKAMPHGTKEEKTARHNAIKAAKKRIKEDKNFNERVDAAVMVSNELNKFGEPATIEAVAKARRLIEIGPIGLTYVDEFQHDLEVAMAMANGTKEEKIARAKAIKSAKKAIKRAAKITKQYPEGITEPDYTRVHIAFDMPEDTKEERKARKEAIKREEKVIMQFRKVALPFIDAQKLVAEEESYADFGKLKSMYGEAKVRVEADEAREEANRLEQEAERQAELDTERQAKFDALPKEKQDKILAKRKAKADKAAKKTVAKKADEITTEDGVDAVVTEETVVETDDESDRD